MIIRIIEFEKTSFNPGQYLFFYQRLSIPNGKRVDSNIQVMLLYESRVSNCWVYYS